MNYEKACRILGIDIKKDYIDDSYIKKKYHISALKYHPDKCKLDNANEICSEINEAYNFLLNNKHTKQNDYNSILNEFIKEYFGDSSYVDIFNVFLDKKVIKFVFENMDYYKIVKIYKFLEEYNDVLGIDKEVIDLIKKELTIDTIVLNPTIDDILDSNIYVLKHKGETIYVPLWHRELYYEIFKDKLIVKCIPDLSENICIDNENNIHIKLDLSFNQINSEELEVILGDKKINFPIKCNNSVDNKIEYIGQGPNKIEKNIMNENKAKLIIHFN